MKTFQKLHVKIFLVFGLNMHMVLSFWVTLIFTIKKSYHRVFLWFHNAEVFCGTLWKENVSFFANKNSSFVILVQNFSNKNRCNLQQILKKSLLRFVAEHVVEGDVKIENINWF